MSKTALSVTFLLLSCAMYGLAQTAVGALQGVVTDAQGKPLPGAQVRYHRIFRTVIASNGQPFLASGEAIVNSTSPADSAGGYAAPGLPTGDYLVCAGVPAVAYLDPCQWGTPLRATISANVASNQNIALIKGVFLKVRVNDALGLLPRDPGPFFLSKLIVGTFYANGAYIGAPNTGIDNAGRDYQLTIPAGTPLKLWLFSSDVALADVTGKPVNILTGAQIPFEATAGQDQVFTFAVSRPAAGFP